MFSIAVSMWIYLNVMKITRMWLHLRFTNKQPLFYSFETIHISTKDVIHYSYSRVLPLNWTVGMPGILAATVEDAVITLVFLLLSIIPIKFMIWHVIKYFGFCSYAAICDQPLQRKPLYSQVHSDEIISKFAPKLLLLEFTSTTCQYGVNFRFQYYFIPRNIIKSKLSSSWT